MQDDPPEEEPEESQNKSCDDDGSDATEISEAEAEKPNTGEADSAETEEPAQSLVLGDSLAGDIESIVASDIFIDEGLVSAVFETDESGTVSAKDSRYVLPLPPVLS